MVITIKIVMHAKNFEVTFLPHVDTTAGKYESIGDLLCSEKSLTCDH